MLGRDEAPLRREETGVGMGKRWSCHTGSGGLMARGSFASAVQVGLGAAEQFDDVVWGGSIQQTVAKAGLSEHPADPGQHRQMQGQVRRQQQEEQPDRATVHGAKGHAGRVTGKNQDGAAQQVWQRVTGMGQGHTVANAGAMEVFPVAQGLEECFLPVRQSFQTGDQGNQFPEHIIPGAAPEFQAHGAG